MELLEQDSNDDFLFADDDVPFDEIPPAPGREIEASGSGLTIRAVAEDVFDREYDERGPAGLDLHRVIERPLQRTIHQSPERLVRPTGEFISDDIRDNNSRKRRYISADIDHHDRRGHHMEGSRSRSHTDDNYLYRNDSIRRTVVPELEISHSNERKHPDDYEYYRPRDHPDGYDRNNASYNSSRSIENRSTNDSYHSRDFRDSRVYRDEKYPMHPADEHRDKYHTKERRHEENEMRRDYRENIRSEAYEQTTRDRNREISQGQHHRTHEFRDSYREPFRDSRDETIYREEYYRDIEERRDTDNVSRDFNAARGDLRDEIGHHVEYRNEERDPLPKERESESRRESTREHLPSHPTNSTRDKYPSNNQAIRPKPGPGVKRPVGNRPPQISNHLSDRLGPMKCPPQKVDNQKPKLGGVTKTNSPGITWQKPQITQQKAPILEAQEPASRSPPPIFKIPSQPSSSKQNSVANKSKMNFIERNIAASKTKRPGSRSSGVTKAIAGDSRTIARQGTAIKKVATRSTISKAKKNSIQKTNLSKNLNLSIRQGGPAPTSSNNKSSTPTTTPNNMLADLIQGILSEPDVKEMINTIAHQSFEPPSTTKHQAGPSQRNRKHDDASQVLDRANKLLNNNFQDVDATDFKTNRQIPAVKYRNIQSHLYCKECKLEFPSTMLRDLHYKTEMHCFVTGDWWKFNPKPPKRVHRKKLPTSILCIYCWDIIRLQSEEGMTNHFDSKRHRTNRTKFQEIFGKLPQHGHCMWEELSLNFRNSFVPVPQQLRHVMHPEYFYDQRVVRK